MNCGYYHKEISREGEGLRSNCQVQASGRRMGSQVPGKASQMRLKDEETDRWTGSGGGGEAFQEDGGCHGAVT